MRSKVKFLEAVQEILKVLKGLIPNWNGTAEDGHGVLVHCQLAAESVASGLGRASGDSAKEFDNPPRFIPCMEWQTTG